MRIIQGLYKGRTLLMPPATITRPTTDKTRQALFNILENGFHLNFNQLNVLDAFAGSGAIGFEALSRGAKHLVSIEKSKEAFNVIGVNAIKLGIFDEKIKIIQKDILSTPLSLFSFDLVFLDPPYRQIDLYQKTISHLINEKAIHDKTLICFESEKKMEIPLMSVHVIDERVYGQTKITFLRL